MICIDKFGKSCKHLAVLTALLLFFSCTNGKRSTSSEQLKTPEFPVPPEVMTDPESRAGYVVEHVWNGIEEVDTANFASSQRLEQFLVDYFAIGNLAGGDKFESSLRTLFELGTPALDSTVLAFNESYISHPNSPVYNLKQYFQVLAVADELGLLSGAEKLRYEDGYALFLKNREGELSEDFSYITPSGEQHTLHSDKYAGDRLLIFYNPDCHTCVSVLEYLSKSERVQNAVKEKRLDILCIYADGDEVRWRKKLDEIPSFASVGMDVEGRILRESLYDLVASPTLYLLDADKKVIIKDLFPDQIEDYLNTEKD